MPEDIITTIQNENNLITTVLNYKAISKNAVYPTRNMGMGKIMIEIVDVYLLSNKVILRDWVIVYDSNNKEIHREIIQDNYVKQYNDEQFAQLIMATNVDLSDNTIFYRKLKEVVDIAALIINQLEPPYGLAPNSFEKFVTSV